MFFFLNFTLLYHIGKSNLCALMLLVGGGEICWLHNRSQWNEKRRVCKSVLQNS